jgi:hypothetical protein
MEPNDKNSEMYRLWDLSAGYNWVADGPTMLFAILSNVVPKEAHLLEFGGVIPSTYVDVSKLLYKVVGAADELKGLASQRICGAIETFLLTVMNPDEVEDFKQQNQMKTPAKNYRSILEELEAEGRGDIK